MKSSAVILAACASLASAMPSYRSGNWNSTVVNYNSTTPASWNSSSTTTTSSAAWSTATGVAPISTGLPQSEAAAVPPAPAAPYWSNETTTTTTGASNETWVSRNETRFQPSQTHQPVPLIRRFRPQRKTSRALY